MLRPEEDTTTINELYSDGAGPTEEFDEQTGTVGPMLICATNIPFAEIPVVDVVPLCVSVSSANAPTRAITTRTATSAPADLLMVKRFNATSFAKIIRGSNLRRRRNELLCMAQHFLSGLQDK
jgi:hypothetical protein